MGQFNKSLKDEDLKSERERNKQLKNYYYEVNAHLIIEFNRTPANQDIVESIENKLKNEKFKLIRHGFRLYLVGDELSMLFEAELNGLIKFNPKLNKFKKFKLEDYLNSSQLNKDNLFRLNKILTRNEKIRICQRMIFENIQVSKRIFIPLDAKKTIVDCYPAQSFILICLKNRLIKKIYPLHDEELRVLVKKWLNYFLFLYFIDLPISEIHNYLNEYYAIFFDFNDKLIKLFILPVLSYLILIFFCSLNFDHPIIPSVVSLAVFLISLVFIANWKYSLDELANEWRLDKRRFIQPKLDFKCKNGLYNSNLYQSLSIKQLIPKPNDCRKQFKAQQITWLIAIIIYTLLIINQIYFLYSYQSNQRLSFNSTAVYYLAMNLIYFLYSKLLIYRTNQEEYFTLKDYQTNLFIKILILNLFVHNSLPLLCILFGTSSLAIDVLSSQLLIKFIIDIAIDLLFPVLFYFYQRFIQIISDSPYLESDFVITQSNKSAFDNFANEWFHVLQQLIYIQLYCSIYPKIILISYLNIVIRNLINFLKICLLYKRPLIEDDYYSKLIAISIGPIFLFASIINFLNLDLFIFFDQFDLNLPTQQLNIIFIFFIFLSSFITLGLMPIQSLKTRNRQQLSQLDEFTLFRQLDEDALNQTINLFHFNLK